MDFDRIEFYKSLASWLHPAGAFSSVKTAFLKIFNIYRIIFEGFVSVTCIYKYLQALGEPATSRRGFFLPENCISEFLKHGPWWKNEVFFQGGCSKYPKWKRAGRLAGLRSDDHPRERGGWGWVSFSKSSVWNRKVGIRISRPALSRLRIPTFP